MSIFTAILLGILCGVTEFVPVSYTGHLSVLQNIFGLEYVESEHMLFKAFLNIAIILSIFFAYKKELKALFKETFSSLLGRSDEAEGGRLSANVRIAFFVAVGTIPMLAVLPFYSDIKSLSSNVPFVAFAMIISGTMLFASGKLTEGRKNERTSTIADALLVGIAQAIAAIPGVSTFGAVVTVGLARGFRKSFAVKFALFLALPTVFFSAVSSFFGALSNGINWGAIPVYILGMVLATFLGYYAIIIIRNFLKKDYFAKISRYNWAVGVVALIASLFI